VLHDEPVRRTSSPSYPLIDRYVRRTSSQSCPLIDKPARRTSSPSYPLIDRFVRRTSSPSCPLIDRYVRRTSSPSCPLIDRFVRRTSSPSCPLIDLHDGLEVRRTTKQSTRTFQTGQRQSCNVSAFKSKRYSIVGAQPQASKCPPHRAGSVPSFLSAT
jgi:hypothetical protein